MLLRNFRRALSRTPTKRLSSTKSAYASTPYRELLKCSAAQKTEWAQRDVRLHAEMRQRVPAALAHNGEESFDDHLVGVQSVLRAWGAPEHVTDAALFHSIYGTEGFQGFSLPLAQRGDIAGLIGARAERLAWIFCMVDRFSVDETVLDATKPLVFRARLELGAFEIPLKLRAEWLDFLALSLADWLEQVEGASTKRVESPVGGLVWAEGEAWGYRRDAYRAMSILLQTEGEAWVATAAPEMYAQVFAREPQASQNVVIPKTPPMGEAARAAAEAVASAGCDFKFS